LWITPIVLQALIAVAMLRRGLVSRFPVFFSYSLFAPARDSALLVLQQHPNWYSWVYWVGEAISIVLQLMILREVCLYVIQPYPGLRSKLNIVMRAAAISAAALACWLFSFATVVSASRWIDTILLAERSARFLQVTMLLTAIIVISHMGLTWKGHACGIILGSGLAGLQLVPAELRANLHTLSDTTFRLLMPAVYDTAVLAWAWYFLPPRKTAVPSVQVPQNDLSRWGDLLERYLRQ
jgi:hypothetical protein